MHFMVLFHAVAEFSVILNAATFTVNEVDGVADVCVELSGGSP